MRKPNDTNKMSCGRPYPLGSHFDGKGTNFVLASANCSRVELCLFDKQGKERRFDLPEQNGDLWYGYIAGCQPGQRYGYRVHGPYNPAEAHYFNPNKLAFDPYSRQLSEPLTEDGILFVGDKEKPDERDSSANVPKSVVHHEEYDWQDDRLPNVPWTSTILYEAHVKGLTKLHPDIPPEIRGSYAALGHPKITEYLTQLGITSLELLPIAMHADESHLQQLNLTNYWGYNTLSPFTIEPRYWSGRAGTTALSEFRDSVKALHKAGIEVILDVVFNHTAELNVDGPTVCLRAVDNASYYWQEKDGSSTNWSGCGNTVDCSNPLTIRWIMDCLRFWILECHVDGFRFDLGSVLGRVPEFSAHAPLFIAMRQDPVISRTKLIAEPWDIGLGGYQVGAFPAPFSEWNGSYRDEIRRFWLQDDLSLADFAQCFAASSNLFHHHGKRPQASVNFLTAHDGFTLQDLVSFNQKHNEANGENNNDGNNNNLSNNHGTEGLDADDKTLARRDLSRRALMATLLLSQGVPMILAGDEMGHSQQGNNNGYCQDNELTWLNWQTADSHFTALCQQLLNIRRQILSLNIPVWWTHQPHGESGITDACWMGQNGNELSPEDWSNAEIKTLQICLANQWLLLINASDTEQEYGLPKGLWQQQISSIDPITEGCEHIHVAAARSITVLKQSACKA